jgi:dTDP-4-amino-4,6-dideoxygalactose transaminase
MTAPRSKLAMFGGARVVPRAQAGIEWPVVTENDEQAVLRVLRRGALVAGADGEVELPALEREWARRVGVRQCAAVSSGTAALQLALAALGVGPGDEVVVPALSFAATALAPLHQMAKPVFADIDAETFNLDPERAADAVTSTTAAIVAVHLHGLPADMDELLEISRRRGVPVVEDAAQAHGATYRGRAVGAIGAIAAFSLHPSKNLPGCGEGGLVTTDSAALHDRVVLLCDFGETRRSGGPRTYVSDAVGWNHKLDPVRAAFARSQLTRFDEYARRRDRNVTHLLDRLRGLPGLRVPACPPDRTHAWHILRFRVVPEELGIEGVPAPALRRGLHRALRAEGVPVSQYQTVPLPAQAAFGCRGEFPVAQAVVDDSLCIQRRHLNPSSGLALDLYADGFVKVWEHLDTVARYARGLAAEAAAVPG